MFKKIIFNHLDSLGVLRAARYITRHQPRILMYHRIVDDKNLPGIHPNTFEQQLIYLKSYFNLISINQLLDQLDDALPNSIAITFDDGHADFYTTAWPLLKQYQIPATLYITTGFVDKQTWLWPDLLRYIILTTNLTEATIPTIGHHSLTGEQKLQLWSKLGDYCLTLEHKHRFTFILELATQLQVSVGSQPIEPFNAVTWDQLRTMRNEGLDIGSHSVTHPILSNLNALDLEFELVQSKQRIIDELGTEPTGICYPNGMPQDTSTGVETQAKKYYRYGAVAYPTAISSAKIMHLGRYAANSNLPYFKWVVSGLARKKHVHGEY